MTKLQTRKLEVWVLACAQHVADRFNQHGRYQCRECAIRSPQLPGLASRAGSASWPSPSFGRAALVGECASRHRSQIRRTLQLSWLRRGRVPEPCAVHVDACMGSVERASHPHRPHHRAAHVRAQAAGVCRVQRCSQGCVLQAAAAAVPRRPSHQRKAPNPCPWASHVHFQPGRLLRPSNSFSAELNHCSSTKALAAVGPPNIANASHPPCCWPAAAIASLPVP